MYLPKPSDTTFDPPPAGTHMATCYRVIDLGTQMVDWQGQQKKQHKVMLSWELPHELMQDGQPFSIHQRYTFSMSEKAKLRRDLEAWRGRPFQDSDFGNGGFHMGKLLGVGCLLNVLHQVKEGRTYANIGAVMALPKGQRGAEPVNAPVFLSLAEFDPAVFDGLSEGLKQVIAKSPEYQAILHNRNVADEEEPDYIREQPPIDDDIPF